MSEIGTTRLLLRPPRPQDAPAFALGLGEFAVARWVSGVPWPYTLAMATQWLREAASVSAPPPRDPHPPNPATGQAIYIIELPGKGLIGCVSLREELGFWVARPYWGQGYGTEAASALMDVHFTHCPDAAIVSSAHHDNRASLRLMDKLGFRPVGSDLRFSQPLQRNIEHIVTRVTRADRRSGEKRQWV